MATILSSTGLILPLPARCPKNSNYVSIRGPLAILKEEWEEPSDSKTSILSYLLEMDGVLIWKTWGLYLIVLEVPS
jgi:hypothetical protein